MNMLVTRRLEMLVRVRDFGAAHRDLFPASTLGGKMFVTVGSAVTALSEQAASQLSGRGTARGGASSKAVARAALRDSLDAISRTARALALDNPGLDDKFRLPRSQADQALLSAGRAFAHDARPLAKEFIAHDMPTNFLTELNADLQEFEQAIREHAVGKDTHIAARAGIDTAMEAGLTAVQRLDAIVANRLREDPTTVAVWDSARHVERTARTKNAAPTPLPAPAPATASAAKSGVVPDQA
jgi:hypothetical protein